VPHLRQFEAKPAWLDQALGKPADENVANVKVGINQGVSKDAESEVVY
jgi:hypothetical protein